MGGLDAGIEDADLDAPPGGRFAIVALCPGKLWVNPVHTPIGVDGIRGYRSGFRDMMRAMGSISMRSTRGLFWSSCDGVIVQVNDEHPVVKPEGPLPLPAVVLGKVVGHDHYVSGESGDDVRQLEVDHRRSVWASPHR